MNGIGVARRFATVRSLILQRGLDGLPKLHDRMLRVFDRQDDINIFNLTRKRRDGSRHGQENVVVLRYRGWWLLCREEEGSALLKTLAHRALLLAVES
ncbi:MAG: hypothetical protein WCF81_04985 [Roseiarcus sp.]